MKFTVAKKAIALTGAVAMLGSVAACGSDTASGKPAQDKDVTEITVWAWEPTLTQVAKDFTKEDRHQGRSQERRHQHQGIHPA